MFQHRWVGYIGQKAIARNLARGEWILFVDADEAVSAPLRDEILATLRGDVADEVAGFDFPRQVWYLHRWIRHGDWYPDTKLRLFRKVRGRCCGTEPHERIDVDGEVRHLQSPLLHYTYDDIADQLSTMNRFSSISSENGKILAKSPAELLWRMLLHPPFRFVRCYFMRRGFMDGIAGLVIAVTIAFGTFIKYAKVWERRMGLRSASSGTSSAAVALLLALCQVSYAGSGADAAETGSENAPDAPAGFAVASVVAPPPALDVEWPEDSSVAGVPAAVSDDPAALLAACAARMPRERVTMRGYVNMRRRYGVSLKQVSFRADADFSADPPVSVYTVGDPSEGPVDVVQAVRDPVRGLVLSRPDGSPAPAPGDSVAGTDLAWFDTGFDFVWWKALRIAGKDRLKGRDCILLDVSPPEPAPDCAFVRLWVDAEMAFVVQAEQFDEAGRRRRALWVRGVRKSEGRWVFKDIEVETLGTGHRTRLHFDDFSFPEKM